MKKMKMAFVDLTNFKDWPMGGMLEYERAILPYLEREFELDLWGVSVDGTKPENLILNNNEYNINIYADVKTEKKRVPNFLKGLQLRKYKKKFEKYDVIYAHTGSCISAFYNTKLEKSKLFVYHQHGLNYMNDYSPMALIQRPFYNIAQKISDVIFVVSDDESTEKYKDSRNFQTNNKKYLSIGSPIFLNGNYYKKAVERINLLDEKKHFNYIYTGRLSAFKDVKMLIDAFYLYKKNNPKIESTLTIVGDGPEKGNIEEQVKKLKLTKYVNLTGSLSHDKVADYLDKADVFVTASQGEGVSVSVVEAFSRGLPVICFKMPGLEKQNIDYVTGKIAKEHTAESFENAMQYVTENIVSLSKGALEEVGKYDSKLISEKIIENINQKLR